MYSAMTSTTPGPRVSERSFPTNEALVSALSAEYGDTDSALAIMAGHYMLAYRASTDELVPLMPTVAYSEAGTAEERRLVEEMGDFPELTFDIGLRLARSRPNSRLAVLVNDHQFLAFQPSAPKGDRGAELRRRYFHDNPGLPAAFLAIAHSQSGEPVPTIANGADRTRGSTLPRDATLFSEHVLRRRFERKRLAVLKATPGFKWADSVYSGGMKRLTYRVPGTWTEHCLLDERDGCGCSGETIEFLLALADSGAEEALLFVPNECHLPVRAAIAATMASKLVDFRRVIAVWGGTVAAPLPQGAHFSPVLLSSWTEFCKGEDTR